MPFIPAWITNVLFMATFFLSIYQHVRTREMKRTLNIFFFMAFFSLLMVLVVTFENRRSPWMSIGLLVIAVACVTAMYSQLKYLPPKRRYD